MTDYAAVTRERIRRLQVIRAEPQRVPALRAYYKTHPADFISDWGCTFDPRNADIGIPSLVPFVLFPRQREWVDEAIYLWTHRQRGLTEKSRDMGLSWLSVGLACTLCIHYDGLAIGFGSRKEEYVDRIGFPKSLFWKARVFLEYLPREFRGGWTPAHAPHMRITIPDTGSIISGEAGDNIGRGDRTSLYLVDEAAFIPRSERIEASLSATTNCRIDISSANGMNNAFAKRRHGGKTRVFTFHWRSDPRKDDAWYAKQLDELDPITVAQEIDINYAASSRGQLIPAVWFASAIDADKKLGLTIEGDLRAGLDVADEGIDKNAFAARRGSRLLDVTDWSGKGADIFDTVREAFGHCDRLGITRLRYDADGLGAGVRGDARVLNKAREESNPRQPRLIEVFPFRGSGAVLRPDSPIPSADPDRKLDHAAMRTNRDYFANAKAQQAWNLRMRFQRTHRAVQAGTLGNYAPSDLIFIPSDLAELSRLQLEMTQPTFSHNDSGKITINKAPDGMKSPNLYDSVMICYAEDGRDGTYSTDDLRRAMQNA